MILRHGWGGERLRGWGWGAFFFLERGGGNYKGGGGLRLAFTVVHMAFVETVLAAPEEAIGSDSSKSSHFAGPKHCKVT